MLAACSAGTGELKGREGVFGLQRVFIKAGVQYVIAPLWQIPDEETVLFMNTFYGHLICGNGVYVAFH